MFSQNQSWTAKNRRHRRGIKHGRRRSHRKPISAVNFLIQALIFNLFQVTFGAFALVDGQYNEVLSSEEVTLCDMPKSENMLVAFMYKELAKSGNLSNTCPIKKAFYCVHGFRIEEEELPIPLPPGDFKIELNGTFNDKGKDSPVFHSEIFFKES